MDISNILTAAGTWVLAHLSAPTIQFEIDKLRGRTNGSRKVGKLSLSELKETLSDAIVKAQAPQSKALESIAETNQKISANIAILVDRSR